MRILFVIEAALGGSGLVAIELAAELHETGHRVSLIYSQHRSDKAFESGVERLRCRGVRVDVLSLHPYAGVRAFGRSLREVRRASANHDVTHLHGAWAGLIGRVANFAAARSIVYSPHGGALHPRGGGLYWFGRLAERILARKTAAYIVASRYEEDKLRSVVGHNVRCIRLAHARTIEPLSRHDRVADVARTFGVVGRLVPEKRIDLALAALSEVVAKVEGVMLVIVGDGSQRGAIAQEIERRHLQPSAKITGFLEDKNIIYSAFDVLLLPSDSEAFGLVATEAQSFGVPTISTNNGGIDEVIIHGENGLLVPLGETDPLAKAMIAMATDRLLYRRCARGALSSAMGRATWPAVAAVYLDLYLGLGRAHRPPRGDAG